MMGTVLFIARCACFGVLGAAMALAGVKVFSGPHLGIGAALVGIAICDAADCIRHYRKGFAAGQVSGYRAALALVNWARFWRKS